ncbi:hypothetical protein DFQ27_009121 [Actinomortierella ambigua]|uniref:Uncharacterized protein n=1 Tax=Actinomortierella ambigua TaxID=1343610 RepID=A0A9P6PRF9_9FUNG|nr:hypothetical protein DFQ27_009121 [Actinomortierella ambigua]
MKVYTVTFALVALIASTLVPETSAAAVAIGVGADTTNAVADAAAAPPTIAAAAGPAGGAAATFCPKVLLCLPDNSEPCASECRDRGALQHRCAGWQCLCCSRTGICTEWCQFKP